MGSKSSKCAPSAKSKKSRSPSTSKPGSAEIDADAATAVPPYSPDSSSARPSSVTGLEARRPSQMTGPQMADPVAVTESRRPSIRRSLSCSRPSADSVRPFRRRDSAVLEPVLRQEDSQSLLSSSSVMLGRSGSGIESRRSSKPASELMNELLEEMRPKPVDDDGEELPDIYLTTAVDSTDEVVSSTPATSVDADSAIGRKSGASSEAREESDEGSEKENARAQTNANAKAKAMEKSEGGRSLSDMRNTESEDETCAPLHVAAGTATSESETAPAAAPAAAPTTAPTAAPTVAPIVAPIVAQTVISSDETSEKAGSTTVESAVIAQSKRALRCVALISGGKDSIIALHLALAAGHSIDALVHLTPRAQSEETDSYMYQSVGSKVVSEIAVKALPECEFYTAEILGTPVEIASNEYEPKEGDEVEDLYQVLKRVKESKPFVDTVVTGAIFSTYQKRRVENVCRRLAFSSFAPLWNISQVVYLKHIAEFYAQDAVPLTAHVIKVATAGLTADALTKSMPEVAPRLLELYKKYKINVAGEGGEFESLVLQAPAFKTNFALGKHTPKSDTPDKEDAVCYAHVESLIPKPSVEGAPESQCASEQERETLEGRMFGNSEALKAFAAGLSDLAFYFAESGYSTEDISARRLELQPFLPTLSSGVLTLSNEAPEASEDGAKEEVSKKKGKGKAKGTGKGQEKEGIEIEAKAISSPSSVFTVERQTENALEVGGKVVALSSIASVSPAGRQVVHAESSSLNGVLHPRAGISAVYSKNPETATLQDVTISDVYGFLPHRGALCEAPTDLFAELIVALRNLRNVIAGIDSDFFLPANSHSSSAKSPSKPRRLEIRLDARAAAIKDEDGVKSLLREIVVDFFQRQRGFAPESQKAMERWTASGFCNEASSDATESIWSGVLPDTLKAADSVEADVGLELEVAVSFNADFVAVANENVHIVVEKIE